MSQASRDALARRNDTKNKKNSADLQITSGTLAMSVLLRKLERYGYETERSVLFSVNRVKLIHRGMDFLFKEVFVI